MALSINTNLAAVAALTNITKATTSLNKTYSRLASGLRVQSAADDAAGLSIATQMNTQIRGANQAISNSNNAMSMLQVADGALNAMVDSLQRMHDLASQAANGNVTATDRKSVQIEVNQLISEISRIAKTTQFNNQYLINGSASGTNAKRIQIGADYNANALYQIAVSIKNASAAALGIGTATVTSIAISGNSASGIAKSGMLKIDNAINSISSIRAGIGAMQNRFTSVISNLNTMSNALTTATSQIMDADIASETANMTRQSILQQAGTAVLAQANQQPTLILQLLK